MVAVALTNILPFEKVLVVTTVDCPGVRANSLSPVLKKIESIGFGNVALRLSIRKYSKTLIYMKVRLWIKQEGNRTEIRK